MRTQHPPIRVKSTLRPFNNIPDPPFGLTITSLLSNKVSLSWRRQGWRDLQRALRSGERDVAQRIPQRAPQSRAVGETSRSVDCGPTKGERTT